ncbi:MAG: hypothetical protein Q7T44_09840 [Parvibaculum sp.]|nr:hypothetical protein [Parvibaculum sp.]
MNALWGRIGIAGVAVAAVAYVAMQMFILPDPQPGTDFTKTAYDENGNVLTGPTTVGQLIQYVLRYNPAAMSGPVTITDVLSANQTYVPNTIVAPDWTISTPEYNANTEVYSHPGLGPTNFTLSIPAVTGTVGLKVGTGDGYEPVPVVTSTGTKVFGIHHHMPSGGSDPRIMCWYGGSLAACNSSYPMMAGVGAERRATPDLPHASVWQKKIYYPAARYYGSTNNNNQVIELGMGCWDAENDVPCPFVLLPGNPVINTGSNPISAYTGTLLDGYVTGVRADPANPSRLYVYALDKLYCVDVALPGAPTCAGWTIQTVSPDSSLGRSRDMFVEENGTRLFISNTLPRVFCYELASGATCNGWAATGTTGGATMATTFLGPGIDSSGAMTAICIVQGFNASNFKCIDIATSAAVNNMWPASMSTQRIFSAYHLPNTAKVLFPAYLGMAGANSKCYDFAANAYCTPFTPYWDNNGPWTDSGGNPASYVGDYGFAVDPQAPDTCIYGLGDGGTLVRFNPDGTEAKGSCVPQTYAETFSADDQYCFAKPTEATWTNLDILNRPGGLTGGTIVIKDSAGTVLQTITVGSGNTYAVNLSAVGLNSAVTIEFTPTYAGNTPPTTDYQLRLGYETDEMPQICYKTTIESCGEVSNHAVLDNEGSLIEADVNLGMVEGEECSLIGDCLELTSTLTSLGGSGTLTLTLSGPPSVTPTVVRVTTQTGGVIVTNSEQTFSTGQTVGTWALTGLVTGTVVTFKIDAVEQGGGSKPGTDLCCSTTVKHTVSEEDIVIEEPPVVVTDDDNPPPPPPVCEKRSTKLEGDECACRYEGMTRKSATACSCPSGQTLVAGEGCVKKKLQCDKWSTKAKGETCQCLYPGMSRISKTECGCPNGQILVEGVGCVVPKVPEKPKQTDKPVVKPDLPVKKEEPVVTPPVTPPAPECEKGMELKDGKCVKESSFFGDVLDNVQFGVGVGGGGRKSSSPSAPID